MNKLKAVFYGLVSVFLLIAFCPALLPPPAAAAASLNAAQTNVTAFVGVDVIPMDKERVLKNQIVIVREGRIIEIGDEGKVKIPAGAQRIEGRGKFLMPGLVDMHLHLAPLPGASDDAASQQMRLLLANGVTTIRNMIGAPGHLALRERVKSGEVFGPTIYTAGPPLHGKNAASVADAERLVAEQKTAGYDLLKVHEGLQPDIYEAIVKKAQELKIPLAGHVTAGVGLKRALAARQSSIEHLDNYLQSAMALDTPVKRSGSQLVLGEALKYIDEKRFAVLAQETRASNVANLPTLALFKIVVSTDAPAEFLKWEEMKYIPAQMRNGFAQQKAGTAGIPAPAAERERYVELRNRLVLALYKNGARIIVGADSPQMFLVPGFATHREMQSLVDAGLPNYAVLEAATRNAAETLGALNEFGTIEIGKRADLLLLDANPLENIAHSRKTAGVMVRGRWLPKSELDKMLADVAALNP